MFCFISFAGGSDVFGGRSSSDIKGAAVVHLAPIPPQESATLHLVAVTADGRRVFCSTEVCVPPFSTVFCACCVFFFGVDFGSSVVIRQAQGVPLFLIFFAPDLRFSLSPFGSLVVIRWKQGVLHNCFSPMMLHEVGRDTSCCCESNNESRTVSLLLQRSAVLLCLSAFCPSFPCCFFFCLQPASDQTYRNASSAQCKGRCVQVLAFLLLLAASERIQICPHSSDLHKMRHQLCSS